MTSTPDRAAPDAITESNADALATFKPSARAWVYAVFFTTISALIAPLFLYRTYSMPFSPLFIPVLIYPICRRTLQRTPEHPQSSSASIWTASGFMDHLQWCTEHWYLKAFSREEMVWITSMVAAGGSLAPAYLWIATVDSDFGGPVNSWMKLALVIGTQVFGWSLGQMFRHVFVGHGHGMVWPDVMPLSYLIQTLFPQDRRALSQSRRTSGWLESGSDEELIGEAGSFDRSNTATNGQFPTPARKRRLALFTAVAFVYQVILSFIAPIFKSLCLLCIWAPANRLLGVFGSGWDGAGILSLTFDWEALGTLGPLVSPLWAQVHFYGGALLMMYVLTPVGWTLNWWQSKSLPIVSMNVFDNTGKTYQISQINSTMTAEGIKFRNYSPVRLSVNSALGYICAVAAITAAVTHLLLWHREWLGGALRELFQTLWIIVDPRPLVRRPRTGRPPLPEADMGSAETVLEEAPVLQWWWLSSRVLSKAARACLLVLSVGFAVLTPYFGISALNGWQIALALGWSFVMTIPTGFVEAVAGFTLPMDLLPHIIGGWLHQPGSPIETSYFHMWATVPTSVALGWAGVRSFQLAHHCTAAVQHVGNNRDDGDNGHHENNRDSKKPTVAEAKGTAQGLSSQCRLAWIGRGTLIGVVWGACMNHLVYVALSFDPAQLSDKTSQVGWREPGEIARAPASLSSELVVWGIVGPRSIFAADSPYRLLFLQGLVIGVAAPLLLACVSLLCTRCLYKLRPNRITACVGAICAQVQVPLILTGMVAVPGLPANFIVTGLAAAVAGQSWFRHRGLRLVDRSLFSAAMDTGTRCAVAALFSIGQILAYQKRPLQFAEWWGNTSGSIEHCAAW